MVRTLRARAHALVQREDGLSMVEMMVSILLVGLILSALAATLVTSLRSVNNDERFLRATQIANARLERLQAAPWEVTGLYRNEVEAAYGAGTTTTTIDGTTYDYVLIDAYATPSDRSDTVLPVVETVNTAGISYTLRNHVVWYDTDGDGDDDEKRFYTEVEYTGAAGGGVKSTEVVADRAPTYKEASNELAVTSFVISPDPVDLDSENQTMQDLAIDIRFNRPVLTLTFEFDTALGVESLLLTPNADRTGFTGTVPDDTYTFDPGYVNFRVDAATSSGSNAQETRSVEMIPDGASLGPVTIKSVSIVQTGYGSPIEVDNRDKLVSDITVEVKVWSFTSDDSVTLTYDAWTVNANNGKAQDRKQASRNLTFLRIEGSAAVFQTVMSPDDAERFDEGQTSTFTVTAKRASDGAEANVSRTYNIT